MQLNSTLIRIVNILYMRYLTDLLQTELGTASFQSMEFGKHASCLWSSEKFLEMNCASAFTS
jgi:hypothetical protein